MWSTSGFVRGAPVLALLSCCAASAFAADLGTGGGYKDEPVLPVWQGFYMGLNAGGVVDGSAIYDFTPGVPAADNKNTADLKGPLAGLQAG